MQANFLVDLRRFLRWSFITNFTIFLLILAGGIVRITGSGMGCPDWPKCFGQWIPPTQASQIPSNYKDIYAQMRFKKNERLANLSQKMGLEGFAFKLRNDKTLYVEQDFNATKTWIEYLNRLLGALTGVFIVLTTFFAFKIRTHKPKVFWLTVSSLVAVLVQGFLGSIVVNTNLLPFIVTVHLLLALVVVGLVVKARVEALDQKIDLNLPFKLKKWHLLAGLALVLAQVIVGSQVREQIDAVANNLNYNQRETWTSQLGGLFHSHKNMALVLSLFAGLVFWFTKSQANPLKIYGQMVLGLTFLQFVSGVAMDRLAMNRFAQCVHIFIATLLVMAIYTLWLHVNKIKENKQ